MHKYQRITHTQISYSTSIIIIIVIKIIIVIAVTRMVGKGGERKR